MTIRYGISAFALLIFLSPLTLFVLSRHAVFTKSAEGSVEVGGSNNISHFNPSTSRLNVIESVNFKVSALPSTHAQERDDGPSSVIAEEKRKPQNDGAACFASPTALTWWRKVLGDRKTGLNITGDIYEFGVFSGVSMFMLKRMFPKLQMWGFDSFEGLPETKGDYTLGDWSKNSYKTKKSPSSLIQELGKIAKERRYPVRTEFIVGYFDKALTSDLRQEKKMSPAFYIDMDADLYISSIQALDWIFRSGIVRVGTLIGYDDWWVLSCARGGETLMPMNTSVGKAHLEATLRHRVKFRCWAGPCGYYSCTPKRCCWGAIFQVVAYGGNTVPDHGFGMTPLEVMSWKRKNSACRSHHSGRGMQVSKEMAT